MSANKIIQAYARKALTKNQGSGITTIANQFVADEKAGKILTLLKNAGLPINQLDDYIRTEADLLKFLNLIKASNEPRVISGSSAEGRAITEKLFGKKGEVVDMTGKKIDTSQGIMGGKSVKELMESGQVQKGTDDIKISEKITDRDMFKNSNLNKTDSVTDTITYIKSLKPMDAMKEANSIIGRKGRYKNLTPEESKKILTDTEDHIFERDVVPDEFDPEYAKGGRAGYAVGNQVMPAVDARMNLDYNTLVDQNTAQRGAQAKARNKVFNVFMTPQGNVAKDQGIAQLARDTGKAPKIQNYAINSGTDIARMIGPGTGIGVGNQSYGGGQQFSNLGFAALQPSTTKKQTTTPKTTASQTNTAPDLSKQSEAFNKMMEQKLLEAYGKGTTSFEDLMSGKPYEAEAATLGMNPLAYMDYLFTSDPQNIQYQYRKQDPYYDPQFDMSPPDPQEIKNLSPLGMYYQKQLQNQIKQGIPEAERIQRGQVLGMPGATSSMYESYEDALARTRTAMGLAKGGRAGYYTGGITDVEPSLDDIGHGTDALNSRTRLMSPGAQATTSTGLNYLLAEDNDNMRIPFAAGGGGRRAFLKLLATLGGGAAAFKTGILGLGEGGAKKAVTETVKQAAGSGGQVPPYFFKLVDKIKMLGDDVTVGSATMPRTKVTRYKDYELTESMDGSKQIQKIGKEDDMITQSEYMTYTKGQADETTKGKKVADDYEEVTETHSRIYKDDFNDPDYEDGINLKEILEEVGETVTKKADGGRIGFSAGKLAKLGITGSSRRFLEKVFGKEGFETMIENDPRMHKGMLEVVEMFRKKDKEGLKMYMQKFMPHMDDATVEDFIVGSGDSSGIGGQLIRLGSGREYKSLMDLKKQADNVRKLEDFNIENASKNAEGGRIGLFLGGRLTAGTGLAREMLKFMTKGSSNAKTPAEILKMMNPKQFEKLLDNPAMLGKISPQTGQSANEMIIEMIKKTKDDRSSMVGDLIGSARKIKKVDDDIIAYKKKIIKDMIDGGIDEDTAYAFAEKMAKEMKESAAPQLTSSPPKITEQGLLELENIQKNLMTKDRKLQATGGLTTMLGE